MYIIFIIEYHIRNLNKKYNNTIMADNTELILNVGT